MRSTGYVLALAALLLPAANGQRGGATIRANIRGGGGGGLGQVGDERVDNGVGPRGGVRRGGAIEGVAGEEIEAAVEIVEILHILGVAHTRRQAQGRRDMIGLLNERGARDCRLQRVL